MEGHGYGEEGAVRDYIQTLGLHCWGNREQGVKTPVGGKVIVKCWNIYFEVSMNRQCKDTK